MELYDFYRSAVRHGQAASRKKNKQEMGGELAMLKIYAAMSLLFVRVLSFT